MRVCSATSNLESRLIGQCQDSSLKLFDVCRRSARSNEWDSVVCSRYRNDLFTCGTNVAVEGVEDVEDMGMRRKFEVRS
jgi:hypothetical protein